MERAGTRVRSESLRRVRPLRSGLLNIVQYRADFVVALLNAAISLLTQMLGAVGDLQPAPPT